MNKSKFLLNGGWSWAATSPLIYTLQRNAKYAHFGYTKTFRYLGRPRWDEGKLAFFAEQNCSFITDKVKKGTWENFRSLEPSSHRMNLTMDLEPLNDFPHEHLETLTYGEPTISKYMDFYHALHDHVITKGYKAVGDGYMGRKKFYHGRGGVPIHFITADLKKAVHDEYQKTLLSEFDVKIIFIARDPVRRAFSQYVHHVSKGRKNLPISMKFIDYMDEINEAYQDFGKENVLVLSMEELWEGDAKNELSQFLDHPVTNLWKNLYAPDKGHLVKYDSDVPCQAHGQNFEELTPEKYFAFKEKCQFIYDEWKNEFGSLPLHWGEPIEYKA